MKKLVRMKLNELSSNELNEREKLSIKGGLIDTCCACFCFGGMGGDQFSSMDENRLQYFNGGYAHICWWDQGGGQSTLIENCSIY